MYSRRTLAAVLPLPRPVPTITCPPASSSKRSELRRGSLFVSKCSGIEACLRPVSAIIMPSAYSYRKQKAGAARDRGGDFVRPIAMTGSDQTLRSAVVWCGSSCWPECVPAYFCTLQKLLFAGGLCWYISFADCHCSVTDQTQGDAPPCRTSLTSRPLQKTETCMSWSKHRVGAGQNLRTTLARNFRLLQIAPHRPNLSP